MRTAQAPACCTSAAWATRAGDKPRPEGGATSDHFIDIEKLTFEPKFAEYVRDAFAPVGLMLDFWSEQLERGDRQQAKIYVINDLPTAWSGSVRVQVRGPDGLPRTTGSQPVSVEPYGRTIVPWMVFAPRDPGNYTLAAELVRGKDKPVRSLRDFRVP